MSEHHYIPQFYLRGFIDPDTPEDQEAYLWIHEPGREWRRRAPVNVAAESGYYNFTDVDGRVREDVEHMLSRAEDIAARIIRRRILRQRLPTRQQRAELATFIALMHVRVPVLIEHIQATIAEAPRTHMRLIFEVGSQDPREWDAFKESFRRRTGFAIPDDATPDLFDPSHYEISTPRPAALALALRNVEIWKYMAPMDWTFLVSSGADYFITSDCPVCVVRPVLRRPDGGLLTPGVEVTFPFSRNVALVMSWRDRDTIGFRPADVHAVEQINRRTALRARVLMAPKPSFPGSADTTAQRTGILPIVRPRVMPLKGERGYGIEFRQPPAYPGAEGWLEPVVS